MKLTHNNILFSGHRAHTVFVGVHVPGQGDAAGPVGHRRRSHHRRHRHHRPGKDEKDDDRPRKGFSIYYAST